MLHSRTNPVRIAVVGHTNTGKTSLMRTLTRDAGFGEVSSRPSTTRHVEGARLIVDGEVLVELYDTPGMEDPIALLEMLDRMDSPDDERLDGPARVERFLANPVHRGRFEQEGKVLKQMLASDAALYVIDARDPVLAKHRDELAILGSCAIPLLPVLNFVSSVESGEAAWREALSRLGLHAVVRFDTVAPERDGERRLYETLGMLVGPHRPLLDRLVAGREREAAVRHTAAMRLVAELLIDVAACRIEVVDDSSTGLDAAVNDLNERVRQREQHCVEALLGLYRFRPDDVDADHLPLIDGRWESDLFNPETLRDLGVKLGTGAVAGAAAGAGIDLMVGGITLGAAAALGALAGGGWQALRHFGDRFVGTLTGKHQLAVNDAILRILALRQLHLVRALEARGHAAVEPIGKLVAESGKWREGTLPRPLHRARSHREWSGLDGSVGDEGGRSDAIEALRQLMEHEPEWGAEQS
ncbi:MAG TPA: DUF3482 domain-containing protein [Rhodocyclaceae bacterium]|nr:DUF3482 domain-containing protein [Rhodocyclaceae bacterium]HRQ45351.1 DUF3482 domain-containing protein [Rhodocyclaceae bacterium]